MVEALKYAKTQLEDDALPESDDQVEIDEVHQPFIKLLGGLIDGIDQKALLAPFDTLNNEIDAVLKALWPNDGEEMEEGKIPDVNEDEAQRIHDEVKEVFNEHIRAGRIQGEKEIPLNPHA